ncbi:radiation-inducible immediate-early gene IEX-1 [Cuculus canorus]|uniref:radiation-inducible immediate-early gene IEX-1 n=1 Tax=Cuculus canorus TaxID=55661 RepID=UPI0023AA7C59|nr:radiation-inducible immediate-early gene IEX-1 [Cuculus canorus]
MTMTVTMAAAAATTCSGRGWGRSEGFPGGVTPSPPRYFTFETPAAPSSNPRPRRRLRRVLYPPAVRRPLPAEEPNVAKRLLVLLLAVVSAQVYNTPEEGTPEVAVTAVVTPETPKATLEAPPMTPVTPTLPAVTSRHGALLRTAGTPPGTTWTPNGTLVRTPAAPMGASCPRLLLSPTLQPHNSTAAH